MSIEEWRQKIELDTDRLVALYTAEHPEYEIDEVQPAKRGLANCIATGRRNGERVVFKRFAGEDRKNRESFALRYWEPTGLVPKFLDEDEIFVIMAFLPGVLLQEILESVTLEVVGWELGKALAKLSSVPLREDVARRFLEQDYSGTSIKDYFKRILHPSRSICDLSVHYQASEFRSSIETIDSTTPFILSQHHLMYNQDIRNVMFDGDEFCGFFDLESSFIGTEAMQIGSLWWLLRIAERQMCSGRLLWESIARGYGEGRGRDLTEQEVRAVRAFSMLLVWRDISSYGNWKGEDARALEDSSEAAPRYRTELEMIPEVMCISGDWSRRCNT